MFQQAFLLSSVNIKYDVKRTKGNCKENLSVDKQINQTKHLKIDYLIKYHRIIEPCLSEKCFLYHLDQRLNIVTVKYLNAFVAGPLISMI